MHLIVKCVHKMNRNISFFEKHLVVLRPFLINQPDSFNPECSTIYPYINSVFLF